MYVLEHETDSVLGKVISRIKPTEAEKKDEAKLAEEISARLRKVVPPYIEVMLAGSIAKDTNLRGDRDFDLFLLFPLSHTLKDLETSGLEWAKKAIEPHKWHVGYAEHPYLRANYKGSKLDIVPSFKISHIDERASSVDRSPLHTQYINSKLTPSQKDQVRLLKKFLKSLGIYGAELKTEGFSGYLCELLILYYGSFKQLLKSADQWKGQVVLDIERHYGEHELAGRFMTPLVVVDPVDPKRNVSAVVSQTSVNRLIYSTREFLKRPREEFFFSEKKLLTVQRARQLIKARGSTIVCVSFRAPKVVPDILWPQLKRAEKNIAKQLELDDFALLGHAHWSDESEHCALLFEFSSASLPQIRKAQGPPISQAVDCENFVEKHSKAPYGIWVEGDRVVAMEKRKHPTPESAIKGIIKSPRASGIPEHLAQTIPSAKLLKNEEAVSKELLELLTNYLSKTLP
ncbi:MAG: CCA tRNA nucleotidyltransferase [Candidatus Micrarchaeota archaeon]